jgi:hypothetical protein
MSRYKNLNRRTFLKCSMGGASALLGLPFLEAMLSSEKRAFAAGGKPVRLVTVWSGHSSVENFFPSAQGSGSSYSLSGRPMELLQAHKDYLGIFSGASHTPGKQGHSSCAPLSGMDIPDDPGTTNQFGKQTFDQVVALNYKAAGFSGVKSIHIASTGHNYWYHWSNEKDGTITNTHLADPKLIWDTLVAGISTSASSTASQVTQARGLSVLDLVNGDLTRLRKYLGRDDKDRMDKYEDAIKEIEKRVRASQTGGGGSSCAIPPDPGSPYANNGNKNVINGSKIADNDRLMIDLVAFGFRCDRTRVATLTMEPNYADFTVQGVQQGYKEDAHDCFHLDGKTGLSRDAMIERINRVDRWSMESFGYLLNKLKTTEDGTGGNLLDNSFALHVKECGTGPAGSAHMRENVPFILAGKGGGTFAPDFHRKLNPQNGWVNQVYLAIIKATGGTQTSFNGCSQSIDLMNARNGT